MRMEPGGVTAADILNTWPEERLAEAFAEGADPRPDGPGASPERSFAGERGSRCDERSLGERHSRDARAAVGPI